MSSYGYIAALGAGVQALGAVASGVQAKRTAKAQADVSAYNAQVQAGSLENAAQQDEYGALVAEQDADLVRQASTFRANQLRLAGARQQGLNRATIGASGVTSAGSPLLVLVENAYQIEQSAVLAGYEGELAARAREREAELRRYSAVVRRHTAGQTLQAGGFGADLQRAQGDTALTAGLLGAASGTIRGLPYLTHARRPSGDTGVPYGYGERLMPRLSQYVTPETAYPSQTGQPRGVVETPAIPLPSPPSTFGQAVPQAATALGAQVSESALLLARDQQRSDLLAARVQQVELKAKSQHAENAYTVELDALAADERLAGDPSTYPKRLQEKETQLRQRLGQDLPPGARDLFTQEAGKRWSTVHRDAQHYRTVQAIDSAKAGVETALADYVRAGIGNTNPEDFSQRTVHLLGLLQDNEALGVIPRGDGAKRFAVARDLIRTEDVRQATAVDPTRMLKHLTDLQRGGVGDTNLPVPPVVGLGAAIEHARTQAQQVIHEQERLDRGQDKRIEAAQVKNEVQFRTRITELAPLPENLPAYDALLREMNAAAGGDTPTIRPQSQDTLAGLIRTMQHAARTPAEVDDPQTENRLSILVAVTDNPADLARARADIQAAAEQRKLKPETIRTLFREAEARSQSTHWSNLVEVKDGMKILLGGDQIEGVALPILRAKEKDAEELRLRHAIDAYRGQVRALAEGEAGKPGSISAARREAIGIAEELRRTLLDGPRKAASQKSLPYPLQDPALPRDAAWKLIQGWKLSPAESQRLLDQWIEFQRLGAPDATPPTAPAAPAAPAPGNAGARPRERT